MVDYQGNSNKKKEGPKETERKPLEKVVAGDVIVKPKGIGARFKNIFFGGDFTAAKEYVLSEVLLPAIRNLVVESISKGTDRLIYGDNAIRRRGPVNYGSRVQYNNPIYRSGPPQARAYLPDQRPIDRWSGGQKTFEDVIVGSKADADNVIEQLTNVVDMYEVVSIADLYELLGLPSSHVDNKWGWTHLSTIEVRQVREGWRISFPPLEEIQ